LEAPAAAPWRCCRAQNDHALPILSVWPKETKKASRCDVDVLRRFFLPEYRGRGRAARPEADEDRVMALLDQLFHAVDFHHHP